MRWYVKHHPKYPTSKQSEKSLDCPEKPDKPSLEYLLNASSRKTFRVDISHIISTIRIKSGVYLQGTLHLTQVVNRIKVKL